MAPEKSDGEAKSEEPRQKCVEEQVEEEEEQPAAVEESEESEGLFSSIGKAFSALNPFAGPDVDDAAEQVA